MEDDAEVRVYLQPSSVRVPTLPTQWVRHSWRNKNVTVQGGGRTTHSSAAVPSPLDAFSHPPSCHHRQSLQSATCPRRKSLQGHRRLYLGEYPAQLKRRGSRWRPHSRRSTEKAGRMWLISESIMSHCTSNLRDDTGEQRSERWETGESDKGLTSSKSLG